MTLLQDLDKHLRAGIKRHNVPGASLAILRGGRVVGKAAAGVVNLNTRVKTTTDAVFQIGSITKPFTATLIMQLVDEGALDLDDPVTKHLPDFRTARMDPLRTVTIRQLLAHTSGIDGDFFIESGRGDDAMQQLLDKATMIPYLFEPGQMMSYCNLGYVVLGRIIEVLRRKSYDQALHDHIFKPLGMKHAMSRPEDALRYICAIGHVPDETKKNTWRVAPFPYLSMGQKSAGATPAMSASDLLAFAAVHLTGGKSRDGHTLLRRSSVRAMQHRQVKTLKNVQSAITGWGLGWFLMDWDGTKFYGHDGATLGQFAFLRILPEKNLAVALLTNCGDAKGLNKELFDKILGGLARVTEPELPAPATSQPDFAPYVGTFENMTSCIELSIKKGGLHIKSTHKETGNDVLQKNASLIFIDKNTARPNTGDALVDRT